MITEVQPNIYQIEIPLPNNPLKATNAYLIRGERRNLLVDTGFNCAESRQAMTQGLQELGVQMASTDLFITHLHSDHAGLIGYLATPTTTVWMSEADATIVGASQDSPHWLKFSEFLRLSGLLAAGVEDNFKNHPGYRFASEAFNRFTLLADGDSINIGEYTFKTVATPGHTPGHMCLYDADKKLLLSGDHILGKITPNITQWQTDEDVLADYLQSLDKIAALEVELVLPGHRKIITDCRGRIAELKKHHEKRLEDVMSIVGQRRLSAAEVASQMKWDLSYKHWDEFPWGQKLFATGEAMSHLYYLVNKGELSSEAVKNIIYFART